MNHMTDYQQLVTVLAAFLATALALTKLTLSQSKSFTDKVASLMEDTFRKQEAALKDLDLSVGKLDASVVENTLVLKQVSEHLYEKRPVKSR
ncbi:MAG: hypothetical protein JNM34_07720 [Chthonomonadaceae bacterium]|jgi:sialic acid synthase SpsE|nr:hypothetical protein [Chthonomonadaceae bacterium]